MNRMVPIVMALSTTRLEGHVEVAALLKHRHRDVARVRGLAPRPPRPRRAGAEEEQHRTTSNIRRSEAGR